MAKQKAISIWDPKIIRRALVDSFIKLNPIKVIFNALIIIALIPLALKGVKYRPLSAASLLRQNLLIYGLGGVIVPFIGIKIIDVIIVALGLA
jgi:high-affinity K+ transport system ATPase subunit B